MSCLEISSSSGEVPATNETKQRVFNLALDRLTGAAADDFGISAITLLAGQRKLDIFGYAEGGVASQTNPDRVASIVLSAPGLSTEVRELETYDLLRIPDGLQLDRRLGVSGGSFMQMCFAGGPTESVEAYLAARALVDQLEEALAREAAAKQVEDELGMAFVSETQAQELLSLLESTQPYNPLGLATQGG